MRNWIKIFKSLEKSGIYVIDSATELPEIKAASETDGLAFFHVNLAEAVTKEDFLKHIAQALDFPAYFGMNWDAFEECITDLSWYPENNGYVIVLDKLQGIAQNDPDVLRTSREILQSAAIFWRKNKTPFYIILVELPV